MHGRRSHRHVVFPTVLKSKALCVKLKLRTKPVPADRDPTYRTIPVDLSMLFLSLWFDQIVAIVTFDSSFHRNSFYACPSKILQCFKRRSESTGRLPADSGMKEFLLFSALLCVSRHLIIDERQTPCFLWNEYPYI